MAWSPQQEAALRSIDRWRADRRGAQVFRLFGFAGTGKTTLAKEVARNVRGTVLYAAFTGKAALVLQSKGCTGASTIHSLIYRCFPVTETDAQGRETERLRYGLNPLSEVISASLVIIDECSMVDERLGRDLLSFGTKVLVLGDPFQLPPVFGEGYFTDCAPDFMLTEIHRQAADNPIIRMSMDIREGRRLDAGRRGGSTVKALRDLEEAELADADQVLVGLNRSRRVINAKLRRLQGRDPDYPEVGDKLVCLKNNRDKGLLNGGLWEVDEIEEFDGASKSGPVRVYVRREFFEGTEQTLTPRELRATDHFTYGYALTVHKSQGSQWDAVTVVDESYAFRQDRARHLYTAVTRAAQSITVAA